MGPSFQQRDQQLDFHGSCCGGGFEQQAIEKAKPTAISTDVKRSEQDITPS